MMLKSIISPILSLAMTLIVAGVALAADDTKPANDSKSKDDQSPQKQDEPDEKGSLLDRLKKELFEDLEDGSRNAKKAEDDKLERAAKGMRNAGEKLGGDETGKDTRQIQEQVIRDLDDLINQLQNPPPPQQNNGGGAGGGSSQKMSRSQMQKMGSSSAQAGKAESRPAGGQAKQGAEQKQAGGSQDKKNAQGSEERTDAERKASEEAARKKKLEMDVWGHLPPHLRDQLLNTYGERMLPKYQQMVKQFYEALSEQGDTGPRR